MRFINYLLFITTNTCNPTTHAADKMWSFLASFHRCKFPIKIHILPPASLSTRQFENSKTYFLNILYWGADMKLVFSLSASFFILGNDIGDLCTFLFLYWCYPARSSLSIYHSKIFETEVIEKNIIRIWRRQQYARNGYGFRGEIKR